MVRIYDERGKNTLSIKTYESSNTQFIHSSKYKMIHFMLRVKQIFHFFFLSMFLMFLSVLFILLLTSSVKEIFMTIIKFLIFTVNIQIKCFTKYFVLHFTSNLKYILHHVISNFSSLIMIITPKNSFYKVHKRIVINLTRIALQTHI